VRNEAAAVAPAARPGSRRKSGRSTERRQPVRRRGVDSEQQRQALAAATVQAPATPRRKSARRSVLRRPVTIAAGVGCAAAVVAAAVLLTGGSPPHTVSAPDRLRDYVQAPALAAGMGASTLLSRIVSSSGGEARHVVDAVYEDSAGQGGPQIVLFVGGNLAGSAGSFIDSLTQALPGAFRINPGSMQGQAACVPARSGRLAECAWADNDTFGVLASPTLSAAALGAELRQMRPLVEHVVK
jgi:hypothetical protein